MSKKWLQRIRLMILGTVPAIILFIGWSIFSTLIYQDKKITSVKPDKEIQEVEVFKLTPQQVTTNIEGYGTVRSQREASLTSKISGRITYISQSFRAGSFVKKNEVLIKLDQIEYKINYDSVKADLSQSQAEFDQLLKEKSYLIQKIKLLKERVGLAESEWKRNKLLGSSVSRTDLEKTRANYLQITQTYIDMQESLGVLPYKITKAKSAVDRNKANVEKAKNNLKDTVIKAPFSSQVINRDINIGQHINASSALGKLAYDKVYEISVAVSPEQLKNIPYVPIDNLPHDLKHLQQNVGTPKAKVYWNAFGKTFSWEGKLTRLKPIDSLTRTMSLVIQVTNPWHSLKEGKSPLFTGIYCRVVIDGKKRENVMLIPEKSLQEDNNIFLLREKKLAIEKIQIVNFVNDKVAIAPLNENAINFGELVITSSITYPISGMPIAIKKEANNDH